MEQEILSQLKESIETKENVAVEQIQTIAEIAKTVIDSLKKGGKVILFGNGGSAADAQHIAAELVNRFEFDRKVLPALALTTNTSVITSIANDYDYDLIFSRQVELWAEDKDVVIAISTSGSSPNILKAVETANDKGAFTVGFTGQNGGALCDNTKLCLKIPSSSTPRIQEAHICVGHIICSLVEKNLFGNADAK